MRISPNELMIVLAIVLIIFGPKQLPKLAKMFGKATKNFKESMDEVDDDDSIAKAEAKEKAKKVDEE